MRQLRRIIIWLIIFCFFVSHHAPIYAYTLIPEYLCETGLKLYRQGYIDDALFEFHKALLANPHYRPAREYIRMIQEKLVSKEVVPVPAPLAKPEIKPIVIQPPTKPLPEELPLPKPVPKLEEKKEVIPVPTSTPEEREKAIGEAMRKLKIVTKPVAMVEPIAKPLPKPKPVLVKPVITEPRKPVVLPPPVIPPTVVMPAVPIVVPPIPSLIKREAAMERALKKAAEKMAVPVVPPAPPVAVVPAIKEKIAPPKEITAPAVLVLDESIKALTTALEIEQGKSVIIRGQNIQRFLVTRPGVLDVQRQSANELLATAKDFGYTYLHIWDDNGRWTLEFLTVPVKPPGPTYEEILRRSEERANTFKLRYNMDWYSFYSSIDGAFSNLKRSSYSYSHYLYLSGPTPYGDIDSRASIRSLKTSTDLTYFTLGLTKGKIGPFEDFSLRGIDYSPAVINLAFSAPTLRGVMLGSPAFNKTLNYTVFWGREGGGRFGGLSPGLAKSRHSFLSGLSADYLYNKNQKYGFSVFRGWGRDRPVNLNEYGYDSYANWKSDKWDLRYELGYDTENLAHLFTAKYEIPKLKFTEEIRNTDERFVTMTGSGWRVGELGSLSSFSYTPLEGLDINSRLDVFQDRLFPNPKNPERWNTDFRTDISWRLDSLTTLRSDYNFLNELGRLSPFRSHNIGLGLSRTFEWPRRISTYLNYRHQENKHFASPKLNYVNEKVIMGLRFGLARDLYYFLNKEFNWLEERFTGDDSRPEVLETGLDWSRQIFRSPFYSSFRLLYRDEKNTESPLSFLSGEDYIEGYGTLSYRPTPDKELYCSSRLRKIWPEKSSLSKRMEADFNAGFRYLWDTGMRWEPIGTIEGYVFKDLNSNGLREKDEPPVEGVRLWLGKRSATSNTAGYYKFEKIRARKAYVNLDTQTLPSGFVLTVPVTQQVGILNRRNVRLDFGVISRTEIWGIVFLDVNADGRFNLSDGDKGIKGTVLVLEDGLKAVTDGAGQYRFPNVSVGEHAVTLDLNSLPVEYLPSVPLKKTAVVFEGVSYNYNIPVKLSSK
jgi:hypothetical protein